MIYRLTNILGDEVLATDREINEHPLIPDNHKRIISELACEEYAEVQDDDCRIRVERIA